MTSRHLPFANRRKFLAQAGGLAAIAAGAPFGIGDVNVSAEELGPRKPNQRVADAYKIRHEAALFQKGLPVPAAIAVLQDLRHRYNENFDGFSFTRFDGTPVTI